MTAPPLPRWLSVCTDPAPDVLDGRLCRTRAAFFEEVARVLRFPAYFGHNWDALSDCLRDAGAVALLVTHAGDLLGAEDPGQFATLLAVFSDAAESGLTVTLYAEPGGQAALRERLAAALTP
ncbi:barstar family protein [Nonomuraea sp. NPDC050790]|uniref:barstar family protein n=1 Tax=Nonomuraea sp. NPDC050790 TaxID=3364371 RepID=UPI0037AAD768